MRIGSFHITDGHLYGPARFMREWGKQIVSDFTSSGDVFIRAQELGVSENLATLIKLHEQFSDWYAAQRFADGFDRGIEHAMDMPLQPGGARVPVDSLN